MPILVLAPVLEVFKHGENLVIRVPLQMPINANVPPVANTLGQVCCIEDKLRLEEGILPILS